MENENPISAAKQRLIDRCFVAFNHKGYQAVSVDSIAKDLKISKKTIYRHVATKEELLEAALIQTFSRMEERLTKLKRFGNPKNQLIEYFSVLKSWESSLSSILRMDLKTHLPHLFERVENFERQVMLKQLTLNLKEQRSANLLEFPSPSKEFAAALYAAMLGMVHSNEEQAQFLLGSLVKGISVKKKKRDKSGK